MRNSPLRAFASPLKNKNKVRTDSTLTFDPNTLQVDSTPVGHRRGTKAGGYGWGAAIKAGNTPSSMVKGMQDKKATEIVTQSNKEKSSKSKPGSGGQRMIMPGE